LEAVVGGGDEIVALTCFAAPPIDVVALDARAFVVRLIPIEVGLAGMALPGVVGDALGMGSLAGVLRRRAVVAEGEEVGPGTPVASIVPRAPSQVIPYFCAKLQGLY
jgi:hypothetical protein